MYSSDINKIKELIINNTHKRIKPIDFEQYKEYFVDFNVFYSDKPDADFYQIFFYDRTKEYTSNQTEFNFENKEVAKKLYDELGRYNQILKEEKDKILNPIQELSEKISKVGYEIATERKYYDMRRELIKKLGVETKAFAPHIINSEICIGDSVGYAFLSFYERNIQREEAEEAEEMEKYEGGNEECSICGGDGCIHCEPHRFVDFTIYP